MDARALQRDDAQMPLDLTDRGLETAARACRALAHVELESAEKISDPALRGSVQQRARCAAALAERFERSSKKG
jgi:ABC-type Fe3+/spermidine/putrescine transport system ATPase subunit